MNASDAQRMQDVYLRASASMLQYLRGASLYAGKDRDLLAAVNRIADEESVQLDAMADTLDAKRIVRPAVGAYPFQFTDLNFVAVRSVIPKLRADFRVQLAALELDAAEVTDCEAKAALGNLLDSHRKHLDELDALSA